MRRVFDLKAALEDLTTVPPDRQKIIGLVKGKLPPDQATMCEDIFPQAPIIIFS
jgi:ubiquitin-like domain-containing CTD phosphatase 1